MTLPNLDIWQQIVDSKGYPTLPFHIWWQEFVKNQNNTNDELSSQISAITGLDSSVTEALSAADDSILVSSGTIGASITATDAGTTATISISAHTRVYGNGSAVSVSSGAVAGLSFSTTYYIYYDQPTRVGGPVSYQATTSKITAVQVNDRHFIGQITTPANGAADTSGTTPDPPGFGFLPGSGGGSSYSGFLTTNIRSISSSTTANSTDVVLLVDASGGAVTLTLPPAATSQERILFVKKIDASGNSVIIDGDASDTIDGAATKSFSTQYEAYTIVCNGTAWYIV